uniref:Uncharacterized protein n=1 Tax=Anguilla anguilla TaxID=7936 RepID=A0A0E9UMC1_ANGAN
MKRKSRLSRLLDVSLGSNPDRRAMRIWGSCRPGYGRFSQIGVHVHCYLAIPHWLIGHVLHAKSRI